MLYRDSRDPLIWGSVSKTTKIFWDFLCSTYCLQSMRKSDTRNFCLFVYLRSYIDKSRFSFFTNSAIKPQLVLLANEPIFAKNTSIIFSSNISLHIGKNPGKKLCRVLKMELKMYTSVCLKFVFEKIKFKVLHYIN